METVKSLRLLALRFSLNRTIVGWKPEAIWPEFVNAMRFKSHHSGMETQFSKPLQLPQKGFKSHHSGMET